MPSLPPFVSHCLELLAPLGPVRARRMFGGYGLYLDDAFVALIADERLYLKADDTSRAAFERAGCQPFTYARQGHAAIALGYWSAPDDALESPPAMAPWARLSLAAALKARTTQRAASGRARPTPKRRASAVKAASKRAARGRG